MKLLSIAALAIITCCACQRKTNPAASIDNASGNPVSNNNSMLLGKHTKQDLQQAPYNSWFNKNYESYSIDSTIANQLKPLLKNKSFEIFLGTWCGDSKREVPRMLKVLEYAGVKPSHIQLIMVDNADSTYKQSPGREEKGKNIHRVPTLIVYEKGRELNRIVESPVNTLEKDLLAVAGQQVYQPNYKAAARLYALLQTRNAADLIKDSANIIGPLKERIKNSGELNTLGYVWMAAGETDKALLALELNAILYPTVANVYDSLGEINMKLGKKAVAKACYQKVLQLKPDDSNAKKMLAVLN